MRFNLVSNIGNGVGLQRDYELLRGELESLGHDVAGVQFNGSHLAPAADVNIFLEVVEPRFFPSAPKQWVIPNPEWWFPGWDAHLAQFEKVLAKTRHCETLFRNKARCEFLGWRSRDFFDPAIPRERSFLHLAGKSQTKNTAAVVEAWQRLPNANLTVVGEHRLNVPKGVTWIRRVPEADLPALLNRNLFHIMPSGYEGWGHSLHEALGVGAVVITTNAPPMNEVSPAIYAKPNNSRPYNSAALWWVSASHITTAVKHALDLGPDDIESYQAGARASFLAESESFHERLVALVGSA